MAHTSVPNASGVKSPTGVSVQPIEIKKRLSSKYDLLADFVRRFGNELIQYCKNKFNVEIVVCARHAFLVGISANDIDLCKTHIQQFMKERRFCIPIPVHCQHLDSDVLGAANKDKCVFAIKNMDGTGITDKNMLRWLDPFGSFEVLLKTTGGDLKTDILILLTNEKSDPLDVQINDYRQFLNKIPLKTMQEGSANRHIVDKQLMNEHVQCTEVWSVVVLQTSKKVDVNKHLRRSFDQIFGRAECMNYTDICLSASVSDNVRKQVNISEIVKCLVSAATALPKGMQNIKSVEVRVRTNEMENVKYLIDDVFRRSYRVFETFPKQKQFKKTVDSMRITQTRGKIEETKASAIVNSTTTRLTFEGVCSKAILRAAGDELEKECRTSYPDGIPECFVAFTRSHQLKMKGVEFIFHIALPKYNGCNGIKVKTVVKKCLYVAEQLKCKSIAIPTLGVGGLGYPWREAAFYTYEAVNEYFMEISHSDIQQVKIIVYDGDKCTVKAFDNEKYRRQSKVSDPLVALDNHDLPSLLRFWDQRTNKTVRILTKRNATYPAYAVPIFFHSGTFQNKDDSKTRNDQILVPTELRTNDAAALGKYLKEERITNVIWYLDSKSEIPHLHQVYKIVATLEEMAKSQDVQYLRNVNVVVEESDFNTLQKDEELCWIVTSYQEEPSYILEVVVERNESLDVARKSIESVFYKDHKQSSTAEPTYAFTSTISALVTDKSSCCLPRHVSDKLAYEIQLKEPLPSSCNTLQPDTNGNPLYKTIAETRVDPASTYQTTSDKDDDPTYDKIDPSAVGLSATTLPCLPIQYSFATNNIEKGKTTVPVIADDGTDISSNPAYSTYGASTTPQKNDQLNCCEVSALLNPGIVDYLLQHDMLQRWEESVQNRYVVRISCNTKEFTVSGKLENIAAFEAYLQNDFPEYDFDEINIKDEYFSLHSTINISMKELEYHYICNRRNNSASVSNIKSMWYDFPNLKATGLATDLEHLQIEIKQLLSTATRETVVFSESSQAKNALLKYKCRNKGIIVTVNENTILMYGEPQSVFKAFCSLRPLPQFARKFKIPRSSLHLEVMQGDIRNACADFIAVSSTARMTDQKGTGKLIHDMLGGDYDASCKLSIQTHGEIKRGDCRVIATGLCVRKWIGNVFLCRKTGQTSKEHESAVAGTYSKCLEEADKHGCPEIAMTLIGSDGPSGGFGTEICMNGLCQSLETFEPKHLQVIRLVEYDTHKEENISLFLTGKKEWTYSTAI